MGRSVGAAGGGFKPVGGTGGLHRSLDRSCIARRDRRLRRPPALEHHRRKLFGRLLQLTEVMVDKYPLHIGRGKIVLKCTVLCSVVLQVTSD
jgi:hypothetical protein